MMSTAPLRVGWCPGALRPMLSGDGLIVRVKPRGGILTVEQASEIGRAALDHGSGDLDLTGRANLQVRGVTDASLPRLAERLDAVGLLDPSPEAEAVRNVVASPLAGLDPRAVFDIRPVVAALEDRLVNDPSLHALPAKFGIVVDDGGTFGLDEVRADIRFLAFADADGPRFRILLGRDLPQPSRLPRATVSRHAGEGECAAAEVPEVVAALARLVIEAPLPFSRPAGDGGPTASGRMRAAPGLPDDNVLAVAASFGRLRAEQLLSLVDATAADHIAELRLTPWRIVLVPGVAEPAATRIADACRHAGWITDAADPRLAVAACPGAPGCRRGSTPVLDHAARLAGQLGRSSGAGPLRLHVSGCSKGCAHPGEADYTLVGHDGVYDVVLHGRAGSEPLIRDLAFVEAAARIEAWAGGEARP